MAESQDPLELLRSAIASGILPTLLDSANEPTPEPPTATTVSFSSTTLPITTPTRLTSQLNDSANLLTLQALIYVYLERDTGNADYMRKAAPGVGAGFRPVGILDRKSILEYLLGGQAPAGRVLVEGSKPEERHFEGAPRGSTTSAVELGQVSQDLTASSSAVPAKRKYVPDEKDKEFCKKITAMIEKPSTELYDSLRHLPPGKKANFTTLRTSIFNERIKPLRESLTRAKEGKPVKAPEADVPRERESSRGARKHRSTQQNIILLSSSPTALISLWNVKRFLEKGEYEKNDDAKTRLRDEEGIKNKEEMVVIYKSVTNPNGEEKKHKYYAIDSVDVLQKLAGSSGDPWDRVACIFTTGQSWQFKAYKWDQPKELFRNVLGIYFRLSHEQQHSAVKEWNVKEFTIDAKHRHTDRPVVGSFWQALEKASMR